MFVWPQCPNQRSDLKTFNTCGKLRSRAFQNCINIWVMTPGSETMGNLVRPAKKVKTEKNVENLTMIRQNTCLTTVSKQGVRMKNFSYFWKAQVFSFPKLSRGWSNEPWFGNDGQSCKAPPLKIKPKKRRKPKNDKTNLVFLWPQFPNQGSDLKTFNTYGKLRSRAFQNCINIWVMTPGSETMGNRVRPPKKIKNGKKCGKSYNDKTNLVFLSPKFPN